MSEELYSYQATIRVSGTTDFDSIIKEFTRIFTLQGLHPIIDECWTKVDQVNLLTLSVRSAAEIKLIQINTFLHKVDVAHGKVLFHQYFTWFGKAIRTPAHTPTGDSANP